MNVVLVEPEIPPNTGNVARLCLATQSTLHLVGRLGFSLEDKHLKRAGLDYWELVSLKRHASLADLWRSDPNGRFLYVSKKATRLYTEIQYRRSDYLVFGSETWGLPEEVLIAHPETTITIPMFGPVRSLNLATAVAIVLYEALRQIKRF